jgi:hypothetical protein
LAIETTTLIPANMIIWSELRISGSIRVKTRVKEIYEPTRRLSHAGHESLKIISTDPIEKLSRVKLTRVDSYLSEHYNSPKFVK